MARPPKRIRGYTEDETRLLVALCCMPEGWSVWRSVVYCLAFSVGLWLLFYFMGW